MSNFAPEAGKPSHAALHRARVGACAASALRAGVAEDQMPENTGRIAGIAGHGQPRAFALVAACCRRPMDAEAVAALRDVAAAGVDWPAVLGLARRHRVEALVHEALTTAGIDIPPPAAARLAGRTHDIARRNLAMAAEIVRIQRAFLAAAEALSAGVPVVLSDGVDMGQHWTAPPVWRVAQNAGAIARGLVAALAYAKETGVPCASARQLADSEWGTSATWRLSEAYESMLAARPCVRAG
jgi:Uncharacterised nucleotidyltransferase